MGLFWAGFQIFERKATIAKKILNADTMHQTCHQKLMNKNDVEQMFIIYTTVVPF